jgi:hypothetical protein
MIKKVVAKGDFATLYRILPLTKEKTGFGSVVYLDSKEDRIVYTNGYFLFVSPCEGLKIYEKVMLPVVAVRKGKKKRIKSGQIFIGTVTNENGNFPVVGLEDSFSTASTAMPEINYPDWKSVYDTFLDIDIKQDYTSLFRELGQVWKEMREIEKKEDEEVAYVEFSMEGTYAVRWSGEKKKINSRKIDFLLLLDRDLLFRFSRFIKNDSIVHIGYEEMEKRTFVRMLVDKKYEICFFFWTR